jgi:hypothetical protein
VSHPSGKKDRDAPKKNTALQLVSRNGKYLKAAWLSGLFWKILYIRVMLGGSKFNELRLILNFFLIPVL